VFASLFLVAVVLPVDLRADEAQQNEAETKSGYETIPGFGGPSSTPVALKRADRIKDTTVPAKTWADLLNQKWYATKEQLNEEKGLAFGLHYNAVSQWDRGESISDRATGGIFEFGGSWTMTGQGASNSGSLVFLLEHQHRFNAGNPAEDIGVPSGSVLPTAQFGDYGWNLANLYWNEKRRNGKLVLERPVDGVSECRVLGHPDNCTAGPRPGRDDSPRGGRFVFVCRFCRCKRDCRLV
jgi:hypothetical protein